GALSVIITIPRIIVEDCYFDTITRTVGTYPAAIWFSGDYCVARNNFITDTYACGIVFEDQDETNDEDVLGGIADNAPGATGIPVYNVTIRSCWFNNSNGSMIRTE
ncbi:unnamed protein product, partial [marine sediment metagenome]